MKEHLIQRLPATPKSKIVWRSFIK